MFKMIAFVLGLVVGASGGAWYGIHHPDEAASHLAAEKQALHSVESKIQATLSPSETQTLQNQMQAMKDRLKQLDPNSELDKKAQEQLDMLHSKVPQP